MTGKKRYTLLGADHRFYRSHRPGSLGGHRRGKIYGRLDCPAALRAIARDGYVRHRVFFAEESTAIAAGYRPCAVCLRAEYTAWKRGAAESSTPGIDVHRAGGAGAGQNRKDPTWTTKETRWSPTTR
jgi:hypothetical protein